MEKCNHYSMESKKKVWRTPDVAEMLGRYKQLMQRGIGTMEACEMVAAEFGRHKESVAHLMRRLRPSTDIARAYLESQALRLAVRTVRNANVAESIDILSRKSMGVIAPKTEEGAGGGGFFLSVQAESCGAVKIGIQQGQPPYDSGERARSARLPTGVQEEQPVIDVETEEEKKRLDESFTSLMNYQPEQESEHDVQTVRKNKSYLAGVQINSGQQKAIDSARARLKKAQLKARRARKYQKIAGFQATHGESEGSE